MIESIQSSAQIYYMTCFNLFTMRDIEILIAYKHFTQNTIIELGEDWRIESGLLSQQISAIFKQSMSAEAQSLLHERLQFNIFNELILPFLKGKLGRQKEVCELSQTVLQDQYTQQLNNHFQLNSKITSSLTFSTLSLGLCIKSVQMWYKNFGNISNVENKSPNLEPLCILHKQKSKNLNQKRMGQNFSSMGASTIRNNFSNFDLGSCQQSNSQVQDKHPHNSTQQKWCSLQNLEYFTVKQINGISQSLLKAKVQKTQNITNFAVNLHEFNISNKKVRVLSVNCQFYRNAFIVWLVFNIKLFFSITFEQYCIYFKQLISNWSDNLESALKRFYGIIQNQWALLLKDYSVALHDDLQVLTSLINRVKQKLYKSWKLKHQQIYKKINSK